MLGDTVLRVKNYTESVGLLQPFLSGQEDCQERKQRKLMPKY